MNLTGYYQLLDHLLHQHGHSLSAVEKIAQENDYLDFQQDLRWTYVFLLMVNNRVIIRRERSLTYWPSQSERDAIQMGALADMTVSGIMYARDTTQKCQGNKPPQIFDYRQVNIADPATVLWPRNQQSYYDL